MQVFMSTSPVLPASALAAFLRARVSSRVLAWLPSAAIVLVLIPVYFTAWGLPAIGLFHDDGVYVVTAKALAEGQGYRIISLPDEPRQTKYPPLFPALLAVIWKVGPTFPANVPWLKAVPLLAAFAWFGLTALLFRRLGVNDQVWPTVIVCIASLPSAVYLSTSLMSETLFAALCTGTLYCLETLDDTQSGQRLLLAAILAAAATLTRAIGITLVIGGAAWLLLMRRDLGRFLLFTAVSAMLLIPWVTWVSASSEGGYYGITNYRDWNILGASSLVPLAVRVRVVLVNAMHVALAPASVIGLPLTSIAAALTTAMLAMGLVRRPVYTRATTWFVVVYLAAVLCWAWPPTRFVIVVLPLLAWIAISGIPARPMTPAAVALVLAVISASNLARTLTLVRHGAEYGAINEGGPGERWSDILNAAMWVRTHATMSDRLVTHLDPTYYLLTGRKAIRGFDADPFILFYGPAGQNPLGNNEEAWQKIRVNRGTLVIDSADQLFAESPYLRARYAQWESRGLLAQAGETGPIRFLRVR